jgi:hypothetical protein
MLHGSGVDEEKVIVSTARNMYCSATLRSEANILTKSLRRDATFCALRYLDIVWACSAKTVKALITNTSTDVQYNCTLRSTPSYTVPFNIHTSTYSLLITIDVNANATYK